METAAPASTFHKAPFSPSNPELSPERSTSAPESTFTLPVPLISPERMREEPDTFTVPPLAIRLTNSPVAFSPSAQDAGGRFHGNVPGSQPQHVFQPDFSGFDGSRARAAVFRIQDHHSFSLLDEFPGVRSIV